MSSISKIVSLRSPIASLLLLSISLSHAMEEKNITPVEKNNHQLKGSGENTHMKSKKELKEEQEKFYTFHTKESLSPIFHILVTGYEPSPEEETTPGKYGNLGSITIGSELEAHNIMKTRMNDFFEDKQDVLFKNTKGPKDFIARGKKLAKDKFHQYFVLKANDITDNDQERIRIKSFYTSMLMVASSSFIKNAVPLIAHANQEYKKSLDSQISSLKANILILNQKHAGEIAALNNLLTAEKTARITEQNVRITEQNARIAEQNAHLLTQAKLKSCDNARFGWKIGLLAVGAAGAVGYKTGVISINTNKIPFMNNNN